MDNILEFLQDITAPAFIPSKGAEKRKKRQELYEKVETMFSYEFVDELTGIEDDIHEEKLQEHFSRGFRLGAQIMLAALTDGQAPAY